MSTSAIGAEPRARALEFVPDAFVVHLLDGRSLTVPLEWFPRLRDATPSSGSLTSSPARATRSTGPRWTKTFPSLVFSAYPTDVRYQLYDSLT
jgi:hypothetical protein